MTSKTSFAYFETSFVRDEQDVRANSAICQCKVCLKATTLRIRSPTLANPSTWTAIRNKANRATCHAISWVNVGHRVASGINPNRPCAVNQRPICTRKATQQVETNCKYSRAHKRQLRAHWPSCPCRKWTWLHDKHRALRRTFTWTTKSTISLPNYAARWAVRSRSKWRRRKASSRQ